MPSGIATTLGLLGTLRLKKDTSIASISKALAL